MPVEPIQAIVWPEINRQNYFDLDAALLEKLQSRIRRVPFNENFETSWSAHVNL